MMTSYSVQKDEQNIEVELTAVADLLSETLSRRCECSGFLL